MSYQASKNGVVDVIDPMGEIATEAAFVAALDKADCRMIGPDMAIVNESLRMAAEAEELYSASRRVFRESMEALGYEVKSVGSYSDEEWYLVHSSCPDNWSKWDVMDGLYAKQLVVRW